MNSVRTLAAASLLPAVVLALTGCRDASQNSSINNDEVCADIHSAIHNATLDTRGARAQIELAAAREGVTDRIRAAVDAYYRGDKQGGRQAMLTACAAAGHPERAS